MTASRCSGVSSPPPAKARTRAPIDAAAATEICWEAAENSPAILETWFAGTQGGNAIADVLFGDVNPGGHLPVTFPRAAGQEPLYYNHTSTGRPPSSEKYTSKYLDVPVTPLYPFGHGLSYTTFRLSNLRLSTTHMAPAGNVQVSVDVEAEEGDCSQQVEVPAGVPDRRIREAAGERKAEDLSAHARSGHCGRQIPRGC